MIYVGFKYEINNIENNRSEKQFYLICFYILKIIKIYIAAKTITIKMLENVLLLYMRQFPVVKRRGKEPFLCSEDFLPAFHFHFIFTPDVIGR